MRAWWPSNGARSNCAICRSSRRWRAASCAVETPAPGGSDAGLAEGIGQPADRVGERRMIGLELHGERFEARGIGRTGVLASREHVLDIGEHGEEQLPVVGIQ